MDYKQKARLIFGIILIFLAFFYFLSRYNVLFLVAGSIFSVIIFYLADYFMGWEFNIWHYLAFFIMVIQGVLLMPLYFMGTSIDKYQHFIFPILTCFLIYHIIRKMDLSRNDKLWITLTILISTITLFEIYEYLADYFWNVKFQGVYAGSWVEQRFELIMPRIDDTMVDLMIGIAGGITFVIGKILFRKSK